MGLGVQLDFAIVDRAFSARLSCDAAGCGDWIALGFATNPGRMLGATAVVKMPDADNTIQMKSLLGKSPAMVTDEATAAAICVDSYWPLTLTEAPSAAMSPTGTAHTHVVNGATYWMPDGVSGAMHGEDGQECPSSFCVYGYWPLTMTEASSAAMSPAGTAHTHVVNGATYWMPDGVSGAMHGEDGVECPTSIWNLRHTSMEVKDGQRSLHFTVDLPPDLSLGALHLIFAGGVGSDLHYHGTERGGMTLDLLRAHYRYNSYPPPAAPPQPSCSTGTVEEYHLEGFPCAVALSPSIDLFYQLSSAPPRTLRARIRCRGCTGWLAIGFPQAGSPPGLMPGSRALVAIGEGVVAYELGGRAVEAVQPSPASMQAQLSETSVKRDENGVTMDFVATMGSWLPASIGAIDEDSGELSPTNVLYASGPFSNDERTALSYHGGLRGSYDVTFQPRDVISLDGGSSLALSADDAQVSSTGEGMPAGSLTLIGCIVGFILGAIVVGAADRTRTWLKRGPYVNGYGKAPRVAEVSAAYASEEAQIDNMIQKLSADSVQIEPAGELVTQTAVHPHHPPPSKPLPSPAPSPAPAELSSAAAALVEQLERGGGEGGGDYCLT